MRRKGGRRNPSTTVFISYRRDDSAGHAGRLRDDLEDSLGRGNVFQDVHSLAPGERFNDSIRRNIEVADLVLVVIGRNWADVHDASGNRRLEDPDDAVRVEVETALAAGRRTVPVLVGGASLPVAGSLPPSLAPLLEVNACELRDSSWPADLDRLVRSSSPASAPASNRRRSGMALAIGAAAALIIAAVVVLLRPSPTKETTAARRAAAAATSGPVESLNSTPARTTTATATAGSIGLTPEDGTWDCPRPAAAALQPLPKQPTASKGDELKVSVNNWWKSAKPGEQRVYVDLWVESTEQGGWTLEPNNFLLVADGVERTRNESCYDIIAGRPVLGLGNRTRLLVTEALVVERTLELLVGGPGAVDHGRITLTA